MRFRWASGQSGSYVYGKMRCQDCGGIEWCVYSISKPLVACDRCGADDALYPASVAHSVEHLPVAMGELDRSSAVSLWLFGRLFN